MDEYTFDAFISYSHRDLSFGKWLQRKLETFPIPADMRGERPRGQKLRIFRDQTDLAGTGLQDSLKQNLRDSRFLIVLCSAPIFRKSAGTRLFSSWSPFCSACGSAAW